MSDIDGQEGLAFDFNAPNGIEVGELEYTDDDGYNVGEQGTLQLNTVCIAEGATCGNQLDLLGFSFDVDSNLGVNGVSQGGIAFSLSNLPNNTGISIDNIYPGDPSGSSLGRVEVIASSIENTTFKLAANGEGIIGDLDLGLHFNQLNYLDRDSGDGGTLQINDIHLDDGTANPGNPASLEGFSVDADDNSGIVVGMPDGPFTLTTGVIHTGDPGNSEMTDQVTVNDVNLGNTSFEVTAN